MAARGRPPFTLAAGWSYQWSVLPALALASCVLVLADQEQGYIRAIPSGERPRITPARRGCRALQGHGLQGRAGSSGHERL
jgi:hypothetical protein